jgi:small subunit ribosomal protein S16
MLTIRLQRTGRVHNPHFRVVVCEHTIGPKAGKYVEKIGSYNPKTKERVLDEGRVKYWISQGAKPSDTMHNMLVSAAIIKGDKINVLPKNKILAKREAEKKEVAEKAAADAAKVAPAPEAEEEPKAVLPAEESTDAPADAPAKEEAPDPVVEEAPEEKKE